MANIHSQKKRILRAERERLENRRYTSTIKTFFRRLEAAVAAGDADTAQTEHLSLVRTIDKAVKRGALHRNTGARKKSRAARLLRRGLSLPPPLDLTRPAGEHRRMSKLTASGSAIDDLPDMWDGFMRMVRPGLGLTAFGANIMNLPPDYSTRSHDESGSGQEELYVRLAGSGWIVLDDSGEKLALDQEHLCAVGPGTARALASGPEGLRVLIVGSAPGRGYEPVDYGS